MTIGTKSVLLAGLLLAAMPALAQQTPLDPPVPSEAEPSFATLNIAPRTAADVVNWLNLRDTERTASFDAYTALLERRPDWPNRSRLRANAERVIADAALAPTEIVAFFEGAVPETAEGAVALAGALTATGADPAEMLAAFWTSEGLTDDEHQLLINAYPDLLTPHHAARADAMLWRWRTSDAANELPHLDEGRQALVRARIALIDKSGDAAELLALVPDRLADDPGLAYDRFNLLADRGDWTDATTILRTQSTSAEALGVAWRWGSWRRILARWHMREGNPEMAYALASQHFIAPGERNYADLEWVAGYVAYTYLDDPALALQHFQAFDAAVETPISKGRAGYWMGRAYDALGDAEAAVAAYQLGAAHQTSFYGLLSAERLGLTLDPDLLGGEIYGDWGEGDLLSNDLIQAGLLLLDIGERGAAVSFFVEATKSLDRREVGQLGELFMELEEPFYTVLVAKAAIRRDIWVQDAYFPIHPMAQMDLPVDPALALAIARQESEFRIDAGSSVGALGIMQLMPATAQEVAGWEDLPYSRGRLTTDWPYNAQLGARYLAYLQDEFGPSPVMIAAGYNAGPSRPKTWMDERGDPRTGEVDIIDWIEHIPFRETRNYAMRVTEGLAVYQARLNGDLAPVSFTPLLIGEKPLIRPQARPDNLIPAELPAIRPAARPANRDTD